MIKQPLINTTSLYEAGLILLFSVLLFITWQEGLHQTYDSRMYLAGAEFLQKNGLQDLFSSPTFQAKPLLFPLILAVLHKNQVVIMALQWLSGIGSLIILFYLINQVVELHWLKVWSKSIYTISTPLLMVYVFLWTEPVFIFWLLLYFLLIWFYFKKENPRFLFPAVVLGVILVGLRHLGVVFVFTSSVYIVLFSTKKNLHPFPVWLNMMIPLSFFIVWQFLVWQATKSWDRLDHSSGLDLARNFGILADALLIQFMPLLLPEVINHVLAAVVMGLIIYILAHLKLATDPFFQLLLINIVIYFLVIVLKSDLVFSDAERYFTVLFGLGLLLIIRSLQHVFCSISEKKQLTFKYLIILWSIYPVIRIVKNVWMWGDI
jgi:hypothetical protein